MNINNMQIGQKVRVLEVGGKGAEKKLIEFGIMPGAKLQLVARHPWHGPVVVKVGNAELALGRSLARKVKVEAYE